MNVLLADQPQSMRRVFLVLWAFAVPLIWYFSTPRPEGSWNARRITSDRLAFSQKVVESFKKKMGRLPSHLREIRLFGLGMNASYVPYDGYGRRLYYQQVTRDHFYIKSYGEDGSENTLNAQEDPTVSNLQTLKTLPPVYKSPDKNFMRLYPSVLLMGAKSPVNTLVAELMVNYDNKERYLLIRDVRKPQFFMLSPHAAVEEFFWLPSGYEIIFTAANHQRYSDGLFIWNLLTNETRNLLRDFESQIALAPSFNDHFLLSLSAMDKSGHYVYAFIAPDMDSALAPERFYSDEYLYKINIPKNDKTKVKFEWLKGRMKGSVFASPPHPAQDIYTPFTGSESQNFWANLPNRGTIEDVIENWQLFSANHAKTPAFPYALWWLSSIYADSWQALLPRHKEDALTVRAYGAELAKALTRLSLAPTYLRAMGSSVHNRLIANQALPYRISQLSVSNARRTSIKR